jgi:ubiquinone/menaquinone biosynthesis C-methylase UbiE
MSDVLYPYIGATQAAAYEQLNLCADPEQKIEACMQRIATWRDRVLLDVGAGSGFHAVRFARQARRVIALEPDARLIGQFRQRMARQQQSNIEVIQAGAEAIPLANASVDYVHARFAYFFGTDACLPGLAEVRRVLRPGGNFFVIDVNPDAGGYAALARQAYPSVFHADFQRGIDDFYGRHGFKAHRVATVFRAPDRETLANVFRMDYPHCWEQLLEQVPGLELDYGITVYHYRTPT